MSRTKRTLLHYCSFILVFFFFCVMDSGAQVNKEPVITAQPISVATTNVTASFSVTATGDPAPTYMWYFSKDGVSWTPMTDASSMGAAYKNFNGDSSNKLNISANTSVWDGYKFRCTVTNSAGSVNSNIATLTYIVKPSITLQPSDQNIFAGSTAAFKVEATGIPAPTYKWEVSKNGKIWTVVNDGGNYSSATTNHLIVADVNDSFSGNKYRCTVTVTAGGGSFMSFSNVATLTVKGR